jgi:phospholipase C
MGLSGIDTIVIVIMENRSFDHMLGYLSAEGILPVDGIQADAAWSQKFANPGPSGPIQPHSLGAHDQSFADPQHDEASIALQIGTPTVGGAAPQMGGFVSSYLKSSNPTPPSPGAVMGYYSGGAVPTFDFFARHYCVCDRWFSALPLGTQANRLMAMGGTSSILDNVGLFLPNQPLVYDWLSNNKVNWCAYQSGDFLPFFSLMPSWLGEIGTSLTLSEFGGRGHFRRYDRLREEWTGTDTMPGVIFIEPEYTDGPHADPNDDHAPTGVAPGQAFLADLYNTLTSNPARWSRTMLVITYDEHGGFFDHVPPLPIETMVAGQLLKTTGVRVPGFVISPYARPGVFHGDLDHTSLLQLIDDKFGRGAGYSTAVNLRQKSLDRLLNTLVEKPTAKIPILAAPTPPKELIAVSPAGPVPIPNTPNARALHNAAAKFADEHPDLLARPGWEQMRGYLATHPAGPIGRAP